MSNPETTADRFEIEALRGKFTDAGMMNDHDRLASLFTPDGAVQIPYAHLEVIGWPGHRSSGQLASACALAALDKGAS